MKRSNTSHKESHISKFQHVFNLKTIQHFVQIGHFIVSAKETAFISTMSLVFIHFLGKLVANPCNARENYCVSRC